mmetsp:Transcript_3184/g.6266  ORF Transcript_3184/g.6266 Transcript_3184/m.6266 type:complete len:211 (-) Transcript_3184:34-666(-)
MLDAVALLVAVNLYPVAPVLRIKLQDRSRLPVELLRFHEPCELHPSAGFKQADVFARKERVQLKLNISKGPFFNVQERGGGRESHVASLVEHDETLAAKLPEPRHVVLPLDVSIQDILQPVFLRVGGCKTLPCHADHQESHFLPKGGAAGPTLHLLSAGPAPASLTVEMQDYGHPFLSQASQGRPRGRAAFRKGREHPEPQIHRREEKAY